MAGKRPGGGFERERERDRENEGEKEIQATTTRHKNEAISDHPAPVEPPDSSHRRHHSKATRQNSYLIPTRIAKPQNQKQRNDFCFKLLNLGVVCTQE